MKPKTNIELKREYWSQPEMYFTPKMVEGLVSRYGDKPATFAEGAYTMRYHLIFIAWTFLSKIPLINKFIK